MEDKQLVLERLLADADPALMEAVSAAVTIAYEAALAELRAERCPGPRRGHGPEGNRWLLRDPRARKGVRPVVEDEHDRVLVMRQTLPLSRDQVSDG